MKPDQKNLPIINEIKSSIQSLKRKKKTLVITKPNKANGRVIFDKHEYLEKMQFIIIKRQNLTAQVQLTNLTTLLNYEIIYSSS